MSCFIRQGDLALVPTTTKTDDGTPGVRKLILAMGEDSGHSHAITGKMLDKLLTVPEGGADLVVEPATQAWRHEAIAVPAGNYEVRIQREYTPAGARRVED